MIVDVTHTEASLSQRLSLPLPAPDCCLSSFLRKNALTRESVRERERERGLMREREGVCERKKMLNPGWLESRG